MKKPKTNLTAQQVRALLEYNSSTDELRWKPRTAGNINSEGYVCVGINGSTYKAHRLIWLMVTGTWPSAEVDHRDLNRSNNRWNNLRACTKSQNGANRAKYKSKNYSGFKGVSWSKKNKKWVAQIKHQGIVYTLGYFTDPENAAQIYKEAAEKFHGKFARTQ